MIISNLTRPHCHKPTRLFNRKSRHLPDYPTHHLKKSSYSNLIITMSPHPKRKDYIDKLDQPTLKLTLIMTNPPLRTENNPHPHHTTFTLRIPMQEVFLPKLIAWSHAKLKHTCTASNDIDSTATCSQSHFAVTKFISNKSTIVRLFDLQSEPSTIIPNCNFTVR
jgi:hypothetical protein